jgi:hypothetical protein
MSYGFALRADFFDLFTWQLKEQRDVVSTLNQALYYQQVIHKSKLKEILCHFGHNVTPHIATCKALGIQ